MDSASWILLLKAAVMGLVEGLTEFLPISSTGHLILAGSLLDFTGESVKVFEIAIQTGAMFAVVWQYRERLRATVAGLGHDPLARRFAINVAVAFVPAVVLGLAFGGWVKQHLFHPVPVALAFVVGGLAILWVERRHRARYGERDLEGGVHRTRTTDFYFPPSCTYAFSMSPKCARQLSANPRTSTASNASSDDRRPRRAAFL